MTSNIRTNWSNFSEKSTESTAQPRLERKGVLYWDRKGTALHPAPPAGLGLEAHLDETVALLRRLARASERKVVVMGVSIGGTLGLLARQRVPEAVERVVAISPDLDTAASERHAHAQIMAAVRWPRSPVPADLVFGDADLLSPAEMIDRARAVLGPQDTLRVVHGAAHMAHFDAPSVIRSVVLGEEPSGSPVPTQNGANQLHPVRQPSARDLGVDLLRER